MQQHAEVAKEVSGVEQKRIQAMVDAQAAMPGRGESLAEVAHDARNMVAALGLYCELLDQPGVLSAPFAHYGKELLQVASASRRLVEKLTEIDHFPATETTNAWRIESGTTERWPARLPGSGLRDVRTEGWDYAMPAAPIANLAAELLATRNLLSAVAGTGIGLTVTVEGGARPTRLTSEDLTRALVNLVKNAVEAMPRGGRIRISLHERADHGREWLVLAVEDSGPGIPEDALDRIFDSGYTGHERVDGRPAKHRGLGLAITRAIVETAGGRMYAENKISGGAKLVIELPAGR